MQIHAAHVFTPGRIQENTPGELFMYWFRARGIFSRAAKRGGFKRGGFPIWACPSFFVLFWDFPDFFGIFPISSGMVRGFSRFVLFLFLGLLRAPTRNSPERVCDTIWTFPKKVGNPPSLETPRFSFSQLARGRTNRVFGKPCFCTLPKRGRFDENGENDEFAFYPLKTRVSLLRPPQTTKMTKMADVTQEKAWFRKSRACSSLISVMQKCSNATVASCLRLGSRLILSELGAYHLSQNCYKFSTLVLDNYFWSP